MKQSIAVIGKEGVNYVISIYCDFAVFYGVCIGVVGKSQRIVLSVMNIALYRLIQTIH